MKIAETSTVLRIDPEFRAMIRPLTPEERGPLEANLKADGCDRPLVAWNGILLDGHHRQEICDANGIKYSIKEIDLPDRLSARIWIRQNQAGQRNWSEDEKAMQAAMLAEDLSAKAKQDRAESAGRQGGRGNTREKRESLSDTVVDKLSGNHNGNGHAKPAKQDTRKEAAKSWNVSERKTHKAQQLRKVSPELAQKVADGKMKLGAAHKQAVKAQRTKAANEAAKSVPDSTDLYSLHVVDIADVYPLSDNEADCIITDPPYPEEFLPAFASLAKAAQRILKPGGSLLVMVGQSYLPQIIERLGSKLAYQWTLAYLTPGGQSVQLWDRKVNTFWKPVLWYVKGKYTGDWIGDVSRSKVNDNDKRFHEWGQSESGMADLIERFTKPGDLIVDPFLGGGTTAVVAVNLKRRFVGSDIDPQSVITTKARLAEVVGARE